jgi:hypothetical protein
MGRFVLIVQHAQTGVVRIARRGKYLECLGASRLLTPTWKVVGFAWPVPNLDIPHVTPLECPELAFVVNADLRRAYTAANTPEAAGTRHTLPLVRITRASAN